MKVMLRNVRLAFPALFQPKTVNGEGDPAFGATFIMDPATNKAEIEAVNAAIDKVAADKWGAKGAEVAKTLRKAGKVCLRDGDEKAEYEGYEGNMFVAARSKSRPLVIDRDKTPLVEADGRPYGGCYVNATIDVWAQDNQYGKRINASLSGVQFVRDGEAFGGSRPASPDDFEEVDESEDSLV
jgi:hypothetical protein